MQDPEAALRKISEVLMAAIFWKKLHIAEWLLRNGADPNITDPRGNTPLLYVVKKKYPLDVINFSSNTRRSGPRNPKANLLESWRPRTRQVDRRADVIATLIESFHRIWCIYTAKHAPPAVTSILHSYTDWHITCYLRRCCWDRSSEKKDEKARST